MIDLTFVPNVNKIVPKFLPMEVKTSFLLLTITLAQVSFWIGNSRPIFIPESLTSLNLQSEALFV